MRYRTKYGIEFDERMTDLDIELYAFREGLTPENGGLGKEKHFQNFAEVLFPKFLWHPWALRGLRALCRYNVVSFTRLRLEQQIRSGVDLGTWEFHL